MSEPVKCGTCGTELKIHQPPTIGGGPQLVGGGGPQLASCPNPDCPTNQSDLAPAAEQP